MNFHAWSKKILGIKENVSTISTKYLVIVLVFVVAFFSGCGQNVGRYKVDLIKHDLENAVSTVSLSCPSQGESSKNFALSGNENTNVTVEYYRPSLACSITYNNEFILETFIEKAKYSSSFCIVHYFVPSDEEYSFFIGVLEKLRVHDLINRQVDFSVYQGNDEVSWSSDTVIERLSTLARYYSEKGAQINRPHVVPESYYSVILPKQCKESPTLVLTSDGKMSLLSKHANRVSVPNQRKAKHIDTILSVHSVF